MILTLSCWLIYSRAWESCTTAINSTKQIFVWTQLSRHAWSNSSRKSLCQRSVSDYSQGIWYYSPRHWDSCAIRMTFIDYFPRQQLFLPCFSGTKDYIRTLHHWFFFWVISFGQGGNRPGWKHVSASRVARSFGFQLRTSYVVRTVNLCRTLVIFAF